MAGNGPEAGGTAAGMLLLTPAFGPDIEQFADLRASVVDHVPRTVRHLVVTPERDVSAFSRRFDGPGCDVISERDVLPSSIFELPFTKLRLNVRRPWPPLRGWIIQQLAKLSAAAQAEERCVVLADCDIEFVRPVTVETFAPGGRVRLYLSPGAVDSSLSRHLMWHDVARRLLGLPAGPPPPLTDYVSSLNSWDSALVREMLDRIEDVTGTRWSTAVGANLHFSEFTLYGTFGDRCARERTVPSESSLCHAYWDPVPLDAAGAAEFVAGIAPDDVAIMFSAKSHTPDDVRRAALARIRRP